ncbi:hypothetical protein J6590_090787 [Homalodisca vitripennis]|nr:hypothetical protein J6590_090787 [Homalodisca vitripennis]
MEILTSKYFHILKIISGNASKARKLTEYTESPEISQNLSKINRACSTLVFLCALACVAGQAEPPTVNPSLPPLDSDAAQLAANFGFQPGQTPPPGTLASPGKLPSPPKTS